jgi:hypothetical protein
VKTIMPSIHPDQWRWTGFVAALLFLSLGLAAPSLAQDSIFSVQKSPSPNIHADTLTAVAALSPTEVWAVGYQNDNNLNFSRTLTMHWDGGSEAIGAARIAAPSFRNIT